MRQVQHTSNLRLRGMVIRRRATPQVLAERPPRTIEVATQLAAECYAFADEVEHGAERTIRGMAARLVGAPVWAFWWD